jgi:UDP-glucuronate 4-epimerase
MKILITGVAGFIGFSLAKNLLGRKNNEIYGLDNFDSYYSVKLKKERIKLLKKFKNFKFTNIDIRKKKQLNNFFLDKKFDYIFHFAAQAGVRYSVINPNKYNQVNKFGFRNILDILRNKKFKTFFYASSSSIYGDTKRFPVKESFNYMPKNVYAKTKINNELDAKKFKKKYNKNIVGLRLFTVYGEWGRPDMLIFKLLEAYKKNKNFILNNSGDHYRDFTYINDVVSILKKLLKVRKFENDVYNICSSKPIYIKKIILNFENNFNFKKIIYAKKNKLDVYKTYGSNKLIKKITKFKKFTSFNFGFKKSINWYLNKGYKYF